MKPFNKWTNLITIDKEYFLNDPFWKIRVNHFWSWKKSLPSNTMVEKEERKFLCPCNGLPFFTVLAKKFIQFIKQKWKTFSFFLFFFCIFDINFIERYLCDWWQPQLVDTIVEHCFQRNISNTKLCKLFLTCLIFHSTFSINCIIFFFNFSCIFIFLKMNKYNMPKMFLEFFHKQKYINFF